MKKILLFLGLLPALAVASFAQESRQDISGSVTGVYSPYVFGNAVHQNATLGIGGLISYRYMVTPNSALEGNYQYFQRTDKYLIPTNYLRIHGRVQEFSVAYVRSFTYKNWNPFIEAGPAAFLFLAIDDAKTTVLDTGRAVQIGVLYGAGIAYEISPSLDIRAEYRGLVMKAPTYGVGQPNINPNRWYDLQNPTIGVAWHF
jgi:outer membrane immunogenic protein